MTLTRKGVRALVHNIFACCVWHGRGCLELHKRLLRLAFVGMPCVSPSECTNDCYASLS